MLSALPTCRRWVQLTQTIASMCLVTVTMLTVSLEAQDTSRVRVSRPDTAAALSSQLLKRIAAAVDVQRNGSQVYVLVDRAAGVVRDVAATRPAALEQARRLGRGIVVLGPYTASNDYGDRFDATVAKCVHDAYSMMEARCPPDYRRSDIATMSLVVQLKDGTSRRIELPASADALFLSVAAFDRFAIPYYQRLLGDETARELRREAIADRPLR